MDSMITEAPTKALPTFMGPVREVCENSIQICKLKYRTLCKFSKPYWSNKLTHLSNKLIEARNNMDSIVTRKTKTLSKWLESNSKRK